MEVLLVLVIIAIIAVMVIVVIDPNRQIAQSNNSQRSNDIRILLDAVHKYDIDQRGILPAAIGTQILIIGSGAGESNLCTELFPSYITAMPFDPTVTGSHFNSCTDYNTAYTVVKDANGRVTVAAPGAELNESISVTR